MTKKRWGRRVGAAIVWAVLNYATIHLQPVLGLDSSLVSLIIEKSTWIVGLLIVGLSGTDGIRDFVNRRKSG